jgi:hypothetical protein
MSPLVGMSREGLSSVLRGAIILGDAWLAKDAQFCLRFMNKPPTLPRLGRQKARKVRGLTKPRSAS